MNFLTRTAISRLSYPPSPPHWRTPSGSGGGRFVCSPEANGDSRDGTPRERNKVRITLKDLRPSSQSDHGARPQAPREVGGARAHHPQRQLTRQPQALPAPTTG